MTNLLLDTQVLLWWKEGSRRLGPLARREIETHAESTHVSAVSAWEIAIKSQLGRLKLTAPLHTWMPDALEREGFEMRRPVRSTAHRTGPPRGSDHCHVRDSLRMSVFSTRAP